MSCLKSPTPAKRSYEANLKLFDQAKQMSTDLFDLLRK